MKIMYNKTPHRFYNKVANATANPHSIAEELIRLLLLCYVWPNALKATFYLGILNFMDGK